MKYLKKFEDNQDLESQIYDIILENVWLRDVPYSRIDGQKELDPDSIHNAVKEICKLLK